MRLYTEEQLLKYVLEHGSIDIDVILLALTPLELPSDEELKEMRKAYLEEVNDIVHADLERDGYLGIGFHVGAKLMRDKIQGGEQ
jgi:hypothetical protein